MLEFLDPSDQPVIDGLESREIEYAKDQPEYTPLRVLRSRDNEASVLSRWTLSETQRQAIADGADLYLELMTFGKPLQPIRLTVCSKESQDAFADMISIGYKLGPPQREHE